MRFIQKKKVLQAIATMKEVHTYIQNKCGQAEIEPVYDVLAQLQEMAIKIGSIVEDNTDNAPQLIAELERYCEKLYECTLQLENYEITAERNEEMQCLLGGIEGLAQEIKAKVKIAFFPYKYSMWDSLESIWIAASRDSNCECQVVPIPYYTRDENGNFSLLHYEGEAYAKACRIIDYKEYFLEKEQPDIMYIHNPYDQYNKVTRVDPRFFSGELKKYGGILVYVPYYLSGDCMEYENLNIAYCKGIINSDYIILQSEELKKAYKYWGFPEKRLLALGSPKIDAVKRISQKELFLDKKWEMVIEGKKTILLNTSIGSVLYDNNYLLKLKTDVQTVLSEDKLALIWRPHPLLYDTIRGMDSASTEQYEELVRIITNAANAVLDTNSDAAAAIKFSDAMISDYSSLVLQYTFTGKPTFLWVGSSKKRSKYVFCDYYKNYFFEDGITLKSFLKMVQEGADANKEERIWAVSVGMNNTDGTCGEKVHNTIYHKWVTHS